MYLCTGVLPAWGVPPCSASSQALDPDDLRAAAHPNPPISSGWFRLLTDDAASRVRWVHGMPCSASSQASDPPKDLRAAADPKT